MAKTRKKRCAPHLNIKAHVQVLKALAHGSRLRIVERLSRGDCTAGEPTELVGSDQSTVSKHLGLLELNGIADSRREGSMVIDTLITSCVMSFFSCADSVLEERA